MISTKVCSKCNKEKSIDSFYKNVRAKYGYYTKCKECYRSYRKEWWKKRSKELGHWPFKAHYLNKKYKLTVTDIPNICEVCFSNIRICVDHCHKTNKVRGYLCNNCNVTLGKVKEDPKILRKLAEYLEKHNGTS